MEEAPATLYPGAAETAVAELRQAEDNPRRIDRRRLDALKTSLQRNPEMLRVRPLIALLDGTVIAGNQRLAAVQELGWKTVPCIRVDLDDEEAHRWMVLDNNTYGEWDPVALKDLLVKAQATRESMQEMGFSPFDIRQVVGKKTRDGDQGNLDTRLDPVYHIRIDCQSEAEQRAELAQLAQLLGGERVHALLAYKPRKRVTQPAAPIPDREGTVHVETPVRRSPRVMQVEGIFDLTPQKQDGFTVHARLPLSEQSWNVGLIVGPSGSGKTTVARHLFPQEADGNVWGDTYQWDPDAAVVDGFPEMDVSDLGELLSSIGFSSPRAWLRPFRTLSNGEQFRVQVARALAEPSEVTVVDEFTSVVDRQVAQIASSSVQRAVRSRGQRFVAVSCHEDIIDWLQPDWVYHPATETFQWRSLQRHPPIEVVVRRVDTSFWPIFRNHHYLSHNIATNCECFCGFVRGQPVVFTAYNLAYGHPLHRIGSRGVCLPDYQGIAIGTTFNDYTASLLTSLGLTVHSVAAHPARVAANLKSPNWTMTRRPSLMAMPHEKNIVHMDNLASRSTLRVTTGFVYTGSRIPRATARNIFSTILHLENGVLTERPA